ncbi:MAG TPA: protein kinase [Polyangiaceae bacterium]|nr:protein kinase [Polyangiaceae bacterium]
MKLCPRCNEPFADEAGFCPFDGAGLAKSPDPYLGRTLAARYRLVRRLGTGGMAVVYLARHVMIERLSAIKLLRQDLGMSPGHRERFLREARAVNRINHTNIVEITDFGEDSGLTFLVMEFVEGPSLHELLSGGRFAWARAARITMQLASALGRAHEQGVVHRDLKPENVLVTTRASPARDGMADDFVKLGDFGIAKILDAPSITIGEARFGTPGYIAPEVVEGQPATPAADIYALGVVLYNMVTGVMPFDARGTDLLVAALREAPVKPSDRFGDVPAELEELMLRMIARAPGDRPRDAFVVHDALADIVRRLGKTSKAPPPPPPLDPEEQTTSDARADAPPRSELTAQLAALPTAEIAARWHGMISELGRQIDEARAHGESDPGVVRATQLATDARGLIASLERAKAAVAEHQARVDRLEAQGRAFRGMLGGAIDALSRDRSRELAHLDAIASRRIRITEHASASSLDPRGQESLVWEREALQTEERRARAVVDDLGYQIEQLKQQLARQNEQHDAELADATGRLEGALAALRRMTGELVRTIEEAATAVVR